MTRKLLKIISLFLVISILFSVCSDAYASTINDSFETEEVFDENTETEIIEESETELETQMTIGESETETEAESEAEVLPEETEAATETETEEAETETETELETETESETIIEELETEKILSEQGSFLNVTKSIHLTMKYDDRQVLSDLPADYCMAGQMNSEVTSYKVISGKVSSQKDEFVVSLYEENNTYMLQATATGSTTLYFVAESNLEKAKKILAGKTGGTDIIDCIEITVNVKAAPLTLMFLAGQSNMEGVCSKGEHSYLQSVKCEEGQVYSTFLPRTADRGTAISGAPFTLASSPSNTKSFIASSLTSKTALDGSELDYPLNQLTEKYSGKDGPDSGIAYEWNRLTGEKVWVVNTANGGTSIQSWVTDKSNFKKTVNTYKNVKMVANAEEASGHYEICHTFMFWMQGETDQNMAYDTYLSYFTQMYQGFEENIDFEYFSLITIRSCLAPVNDTKDRYLNAPRSVQYALAASTAYPKIIIASNANESWVTDSGTKTYFSSRYPSGYVNYPLRSSVGKIKAPAAEADVHADIHYTQIGHNENGISAADGLYKRVRNGIQNSNAYWTNYKGSSIETVNIVADSTSSYVALKAKPISSLGDIHYVYNEKYIKYNPSTGQITAVKANFPDCTLKAVDSSGTTLATLKVTYKIPVPEFSLSNGKTGICVKWNEVGSATSYRIYRRTPNGSWSQIAKVSSDKNSYTDTSVKENSGKTYYYTVKAECNGGLSDCIKNKKIMVLASPNFKIANAVEGLKLTWPSVGGAVYYKVYRKQNNESYKFLATVIADSNTAQCSFTDTSVKNSNGQIYNYTVKALNGDYHSAFYTTRSKMRIKTPILEVPKEISSGIRLTWSAVNNVDSYYIYRRAVGGDWTRIAIVSFAHTSYIDKSSLKSGKKYQYTVKAYRGTTFSSSYYDKSHIITKK